MSDTQSSSPASEKDSPSDVPLSFLHCANCQRKILYAPIQVGVEPIRWEQDDELTRAGLELKRANVAFTRVCLQCARLLLGMIDEVALEKGKPFWTERPPKVETRFDPYFVWQSYTCPHCFAVYPKLPGSHGRVWFSCPGCCAAIRLVD